MRGLAACGLRMLCTAHMQASCPSNCLKQYMPLQGSGHLHQSGTFWILWMGLRFFFCRGRGWVRDNAASACACTGSKMHRLRARCNPARSLY